MSEPRDDDACITLQVLHGEAKPVEGDRNWLRHKGACAKIDEKLRKGASYEVIRKLRRTPQAVQKHLEHLQAEHGLPIHLRGGKLSFDEVALANLSGARGRGPRQRQAT